MLGQNGVNISTFVQDFNGKTVDMAAKYGPVKVPTMIYIYIDKSFDIEVFPPVTASLISWKAGGGKGSGTPNKDKKGTISMADVKEIAAIKAPVMNTEDMDAICKSIIGTAKNM
jgi:large subunit ribosomal protein L11